MEPCGSDNFKPNMRGFEKDSASFASLRRLLQKFACGEDAFVRPLITIYAKEVERSPKELRLNSAGSAGMPANPLCSLGTRQEEMQHGSLLVFDGKLEQYGSSQIKLIPVESLNFVQRFLGGQTGPTLASVASCCGLGIRP